MYTLTPTLFYHLSCNLNTQISKLPCRPWHSVFPTGHQRPQSSQKYSLLNSLHRLPAILPRKQSSDAPIVPSHSKMLSRTQEPINPKKLPFAAPRHLSRPNKPAQHPPAGNLTGPHSASSQHQLKALATAKLKPATSPCPSSSTPVTSLAHAPHSSLNQPLSPRPNNTLAMPRPSHQGPNPPLDTIQRNNPTSPTKASLARLTNRHNHHIATPTSLPHRPTASAKARPIGPAKATVKRQAPPTAEQGHTSPLPQASQQLG